MYPRVVVLLTCLGIAATAQTPAGSESVGSPPADSRDTELDIPRSSDPGKQPFFPTFVRDEWRMWTSPFRPSEYDAHTVKKYVIPFALISAGLIATDSKTAEILPNTVDQRVWAGRVSQIGAAYTLAGFSGATYVLGKVSGNKRMREAGWLSLEAIAHTQLVVFGIKQITNRRRPIDDTARSGFWNGGDSFPSGHSATSFAVAAVFAYEYRDHIAVPITAYSIAALVSVSRVAARRHWVSDIFVGASTGFMLGRYIYKRHHNPLLPGSPVEIRGKLDRLIPDVGFAMGGPSLSWRW
jgi:membrane-associated phospholipid phosphatase